MAEFIDTKKLNYEELTVVVNLYPWYGAARKEMCLRMAEMGGEQFGQIQYGDAAMYVVDRRKIADLLYNGTPEDYSDKDIDKILKHYLDESRKTAVESKPNGVRVVGGDFFSPSQYDAVQSDNDNIFLKFTIKKTEKDTSENSSSSEPIADQFCTETMAKIYEEQGYYEQAKYIYSRLILAFPEKNAYFANLIGKLEN